MGEVEGDWKLKLKRNLVFLVENLDTNSLLFAHLRQGNVLNKCKEEEITSNAVQYDRNYALITYLETRTQEDYHKFLRALIEAAQGHVASTIEGNAVLDWVLNPEYPKTSPTPFKRQADDDDTEQSCTPNDATTDLEADDRSLNFHRDSTEEILSVVHGKRRPLSDKGSSSAVPEVSKKSGNEATVHIDSRGRRYRKQPLFQIFGFEPCIDKLYDVSTTWLQQTAADTIEALSPTTSLPVKDHCRYIALIGGSNGGYNMAVEMFLLKNGSEIIHAPNIATKDPAPLIKDVPIPLFCASACLYKGYIYAFGGLHNQTPELIRYNFSKRSWTIEQSMKHLISRGYIFIFDELLHICGSQGWSDETDLRLCRHNESGEWDLLDSSENWRRNSAVITTGRDIYVIGGSCGPLALRTVKRYNFDNHTWYSVADMGQPRSGHAAALLNGYIYVCGGCDCEAVSSCERYCIDEDRWYSIASMNQERFYFSLVECDGKLLAFGGITPSATDPCSSSIEVYDPEIDTWKTMAERLNRGRKLHAAIVIQQAHN